MSGLCVLGIQLRDDASAADRIFKAALLDFFSSANQDEERKRQLESLGEGQREADDSFQRHSRGCVTCRETLAEMGGRKRMGVARL